MFTINLTPNNATDPMFTIDFGDSSPIDLPQPFTTGLTLVISHTYKNSGVFTAIITVFNKVSTANTSFEVYYHLNNFSLNVGFYVKK